MRLGNELVGGRLMKWSLFKKYFIWIPLWSRENAQLQLRLREMTLGHADHERNRHDNDMMVVTSEPNKEEQKSLTHLNFNMLKLRRADI